MFKKRNWYKPLPNWSDFNLDRFYVDLYGPGQDPQGYSDTAIQSALQAAKNNGGGAVVFGPGTYKISQPIIVDQSNIILVGTRAPEDPINTDKVTTIYTDYNNQPGNGPPNIQTFTPVFSFQKGVARSHPVDVVEDIRPNDFTISVLSTANLNVGDDIVIKQKIDMDWLTAYDAVGYWYYDFFDNYLDRARRHIVEIIPSENKIRLNAPMKHFIKAEFARVEKESGYLENVGMYNFRLNNALATIGTAKQNFGDTNRFFLVQFIGVKNGVLHNLKSYDRLDDPTDKHLGDNGVVIRQSKNSTLSKIHLQSPQLRIKGGHGYGISYEESSLILTINSDIRYFRHSYAFNGGSISNEGIAIVGSLSRGSRSDNGGPWQGVTEGIDYHGRASVGNVVSNTVVDDPTKCKNRGGQSSQSGPCGTNNVWWNIRGDGNVKSKQKTYFPGYGWTYGYIIGTGPGFRVRGDRMWREHKGDASSLEPQCIYCDQLARRNSQGNCLTDLPVLVGFTPQMIYCQDIHEQIQAKQASLSHLNQSISLAEDDPNMPMGGNQMIIEGLIETRDQVLEELNELQQIFNTYEGIGCERILNGEGITGNEIEIRNNDSGEEPKQEKPIIKEEPINEKGELSPKELLVRNLGLDLTPAQIELIFYSDQLPVKNEKGEVIEVTEGLYINRDVITGEIIPLPEGFDPLKNKESLQQLQELF